MPQMVCTSAFSAATGFHSTGKKILKNTTLQHLILANVGRNFPSLDILVQVTETRGSTRTAAFLFLRKKNNSPQPQFPFSHPYICREKLVNVTGAALTCLKPDGKEKGPNVSTKAL